MISYLVGSSFSPVNIFLQIILLMALHINSHSHPITYHHFYSSLLVFLEYSFLLIYLYIQIYNSWMESVAADIQFHVLAVDDSILDRKLIERLLKTSSYHGMCLHVLALFYIILVLFWLYFFGLLWFWCLNVHGCFFYSYCCGFWNKSSGISGFAKRRAFG